MSRPSFSAFTGRFFPPAALAIAMVAISFVTRVLLLVRAENALPDGLAILPAIFGLGMLYDLVTAAQIVAPFVVWLALIPDRLAASRGHRIVLVGGFAVAAYGLTLVAVAEGLFWEEFGARFNFIAVDYLLYTQEVMGNIRESYPVGRILAVLCLPALLITALLARPLWRHSAAASGWKARLSVLAGHGLLLAAIVAGVNSDLKEFSDSDTANELAGNGIYEFFAASYRNELDYDRHYARLPPPEALEIARKLTDGHGEWLSEPADGFERAVPAAGPPRKLNVVLVSIESMGAEFLGAYGDTRGLTPNLDRLARESLWFSNAYATGNRTVRGLEALALALPPTPGQSVVRRPKNEKLFSLGSVLEDFDYDTLFVYGGYGYFDNMNAFFDHNDYRVLDRTRIPDERAPFRNIWGVADEYLFDFALDEIDKLRAGPKHRPFFAHIMTTSNHRPYTYPDGRIDLPSGSGRKGAVKYADWTIGHLLGEAAKRPWFADTLFVITADHGANARGTTQIPVDKYRIPVFFYSPGLVAPRRVDRLMSQIDIAPTLMGLLNLPYFSKFFGRDMLHAPETGDRAFVANYQTLGYLKAGRLAILQPRRKVSTYRADADGLPVAPMDDAPLAREAIALYQSAAMVFKSGRYRDEEQVRPDRRGSEPISPK